MAGRGAGPSFIEAADGELLASIPSAAMEYHLLPRKFPRIDAFNARVDSSLGSTQLPEPEVKQAPHTCLSRACCIHQRVQPALISSANMLACAGTQAPAYLLQVLWQDLLQ